VCVFPAKTNFWYSLKMDPARPIPTGASILSMVPSVSATK